MQDSRIHLEKVTLIEYTYNELLNSPLDDKRILYTLYNNKFNTNLLSFIFYL